MASNRVSSILAADFGSVRTRVVLFDVVDGEYRLVAHATGRTTLGFPDNDLNKGLRRQLQELTRVTGREFYNQNGHVVTPEDRQRNGVDYFITTASAGRPIRTIIIGLLPEVSVASALRATSGTYIERVAEFHLRDGYTEEDRLNAIVTGRPDLIFVAGGTNNGAQEALKDILEIVELGLKIQDKELRPPILYAGNKALQEHINERFSGLTDVILSENIRPSMTIESTDAAQIALGKAFDEHRETQGVAFSTVGEMSSTGLLPTAESYRLVGDYFSKTRQANVILADMGSTSTILVGSFNGDTNASIRTNVGLGQSILETLNTLGEDALRPWLPFYPIGSEIRNYVMNKLARPASIPMNAREMFLEQAMMRVALRQIVQEDRQAWKDVSPEGLLPHVDLIVVGGGALTGTGTPAYDMMLLADSLQPTGITEIKADRHGIIAPMSAIARAEPEAMVQLIEGDDLEHLGTLINLTGTRGTSDGVAAKLVITTEDETVNYDLKVGEYLSLPLPHNFSIKIKISCRGNYRIAGRSSRTLTLKGGTAGIVIDARGRPLLPPATVGERMTVIPQWIASATDTAPIVLPVEWNLNPEDELEAEELSSTQEMQTLFDTIEDEDDPLFAYEEEDEELVQNDELLDDLFAEEEDDDDIGGLRDLLN
ncbi:MAG: glutamate mutase L [Chloroflexota bacterium]